MTPSQRPEPTLFGWRRYEVQVPLYTPPLGGLLDPERRCFYPSADEGQYPKLSRWDELLAPAFRGFVAYGGEPPHATAYDYESALELMGGMISPTYNEFADAVNRRELVATQLLGVWFGEKTPYLVYKTEVLPKGL